MYMALSGAQYIHYSFGLLDRTNTFSPLQAVLDDEQIGKVKHCLVPSKIDEARTEEALKMVRKVMSSANRLYARHARKAIKAGEVSTPFRFEGKGHKDRVIERALERMAELEARPAKLLDAAVVDTIFTEIKGLLPSLKEHAA
jgi:trimethylamine--corrinoid protein Co-methyltransferase